MRRMSFSEILRQEAGSGTAAAKEHSVEAIISMILSKIPCARIVECLDECYKYLHCE